MAVPPTLIALAIDKLSQDLLLSLPTILTPQAILDGTFHKISQDSPRIAQALFDKISQDSPRSFPPILIVQAILDGISQDSQRSFTPILIAQGILDGTLELDGMSQYSLRIAQALFDKVSQDSLRIAQVLFDGISQDSLHGFPPTQLTRALFDRTFDGMSQDTLHSFGAGFNTEYRILDTAIEVHREATLDFSHPIVHQLETKMPALESIIRELNEIRVQFVIKVAHLSSDLGKQVKASDREKQIEEKLSQALEVERQILIAVRGIARGMAPHTTPSADQFWAKMETMESLRLMIKKLNELRVEIQRSW
jgi:hypothetical protein